jgi:tetratricopeptide (TPR) repeat protein
MRLAFRAVTFFAALVVALGASPHMARAQDAMTLANAHFLRGRDLYEGHDYAHALDELRQSASMWRSPNTRLYIARTLRELGRIDEAVVEFEEALSEASENARTDARYVATRDAATEEHAALESRVGRLLIDVQPAPPSNTRITVSSRTLSGAVVGIPLPVMPGEVQVRVEARGFLAASQSVHVEAGQSARVTVTLEPARESRGSQSGLRTASWVAFAAAGVGFVTAATFFSLAEAQYASLDGSCGTSPCPTGQVPAIQLGIAFDEVWVTALITTGVLAAAGFTMFVLSQPSNRSSEHAHMRSPRVRAFAIEF